ncbi:MAG: hypothetical protein EPO35_05020 [Acidobacteria bacterium]|nr:MAG: hypothetical protein EPO35_05020 [Acidobacteriota bacterium]
MPHRRVLLGSACSALASLAVACGSSASLASQLQPSGTVTLTALAISVNTPSVGGAVQATSTATFSNGGTTPIATGFGTDTPSVATSTSSGTITGVAIGDVTIFVDYLGMRASKRVHVLPAYGGVLVGTYKVTSCSQSEGFATADFCQPFNALPTLSIAFSNTQSADLTTLTGQFALGQSVGLGSGTVASNGTLTYSGALVGGTERMELRNFAGTSPAPGRMVGSFEQVWTNSATTGQAVVTCANMDVTRTSSALASFSGPLAARSGSIGSFAALLFREVSW